MVKSKITALVMVLVLALLVAACASTSPQTGQNNVNVDLGQETEEPDTLGIPATDPADADLGETPAATEAAETEEAAATEEMAATEETAATEEPAATTAADATDEPAATEAAGLPGTGETCATGVSEEDLISAGEAVYTARCAGCHGEEAEGMGDFPALAANPDLQGEDPAELIAGFLDLENHPFLTQMTVDEVAGALTFVRNSFGNDAGVICPDQLDALENLGQ